MYICNGIVISFNETNDKYYLFDKIHHEKYQLNNKAFHVLQYIYAHPEKCSSQIKEACNIDSNILDLLESRSIISIDKETKSNLCSDPFRNVGPGHFSRITINITDKCNLQCKHCCYDCNDRNTKILSIDEFTNLLDACDKQGILEICISGGEPFMVPNLVQYLEILDTYNFIVTLFSNLTVCPDNDWASRYHIWRVITSIESADETIHDSFRGAKYSLRNTTERIQKLIAEKIDVEVNLVIGPHNVETLDNTISLIKGLHAKCKIDVISKLGRAKNMSIDYDSIIAKINSLNIILNYDCGICEKGLYVSPSGEIMICPSLPIELSTIGYINNGINFNLMHQLCDEMNLDYSHCPGCRARALIMNGEIRSDDPIYEAFYQMRENLCRTT